MDPFAYSISVVVGEEAGLSTDPADPGNWTGGAVGHGVCRGTKYGISAASYPSIDIASLTLAQAQAIYKSDYWDKIEGDKLPAPLALLGLDAAINNGVSRTTHWLQQAAGVPTDGVIGPATLAAIAKSMADDDDALLIEFQALRLFYMSELGTWRTFGLGWSRRLCGLPFKALPLFSTDAKDA